jgi:hypothetical protein
MILGKVDIIFKYNYFFQYHQLIKSFTFKRGITQKYILYHIPCRKSFTRNLASKYISTVGIPLVDKVKRSEESSSALKALEERVQQLEILLNDYYIEDYGLKQVKKDKIQQKKISDYLKQFEKDKTQQKNFFDYYYYLKQAKAQQKKITDYYN